MLLLVAVGGAVGGTKALKSAPTATSTPGPSNNSSLPLNNLVSKPKLASLNYVEESGVVHYRVYFQISTNAIYQSAWNSSVRTWVVSPVTTKKELADSTVDLDVKLQTPIAASVYWHSASVSISKLL